MDMRFAVFGQPENDDQTRSMAKLVWSDSLCLVVFGGLDMMSMFLKTINVAKDGTFYSRVRFLRE